MVYIDFLLIDILIDKVINMSVEKAMQNQSMPTKIPSGGNNSVSVGAVIATSSGQAVTQNSRIVK